MTGDAGRELGPGGFPARLARLTEETLSKSKSIYLYVFFAIAAILNHKLGCLRQHQLFLVAACCSCMW